MRAPALVLAAVLLVARSGRRVVGLRPREGGGAPGALAGRTIVIDPGHQLGNPSFPRRSAGTVPAGGFRKPCNTAGTSTRRGFAEATFAWRVARLLRARLERLGATVVLTRHSNRADRWGPCVDVPRTTRQPRRRPQAEPARRRLERPRRPRVPRHRPDRPPALDPRHLRDRPARLALPDPGVPARGRRPGRQLHRRAGRPRLPLRPRHPQPLRHPDRDGRARQHAQPPRRPPDDHAPAAGRRTPARWPTPSAPYLG